MRTKTAFYFKLIFDVASRKESFRKIYLLHNKNYDPHIPQICVAVRNKNDNPQLLRRYVIFEWSHTARKLQSDQFCS